MTKNQNESLLYITIFFSVFSQIGLVAGIAKFVMYFCWISLILKSALTRSKKIPISDFTRIFILTYVVFLLLQIIELLMDPYRLLANYTYVLAIPLLISIVADCYSEISEEQIQNCIKIYIMGALLYAVWVHLTFFPSYSTWLRSMTYAFSSKNSAAQIWSTAVLMILFYIDYHSKYQRVVGAIAAIYFLFVIGISQCRTALLAILAGVIIYVLFRSKRKVLFVILFIFAGIAAWNNRYIHTFLEQALFLNKYAGADMNTISSGRLYYWETALGKFVKNPIIGVGKYYVDCSYISVLTESGIVGFILIEVVWLKRVISNLTYKGSIRRKNLLICLTVFYIVESLLEGNPPFGPGVSAFMFWFLSQIFSNKQYIGGNINEHCSSHHGYNTDI